jgi:chromosome partitioning protein
MAEKYVVTLRKGGCGKTTTAVNLAASLQLAGKRTLLVDLDPQANATISVGINPLDLKTSINDLFTSIEVQPMDVIVTTSYGLSLLPSHPDLSKTEAGMQATQVGVLRGMLDPIEDQFDYIIIDTPPSESYLSVAALAYGDWVVIPVQAHFLATQAPGQAMQDIQRVRKGLNPGLKVRGILFTMVNSRTNISKAVREQVLSVYSEYVLPMEIGYSIRHVEASLAGEPIVILDPSHPGSIAYKELAEVVIHG